MPTDDVVARIATGESFTTSRERLTETLRAYEAKYGCLECGAFAPAHTPECLAGALGGAEAVLLPKC